MTTFRSSYAQDIETLVMPGEVISAHAELEPECSSCHKLFDKQGQNQLCLDCHEDIAADVAGNSGFHGKRAEVQTSQCASCHTDHEGRDAIVVVLNEDTFDHRFTDFELLDSHQEAECADCHEADVKFRDAPDACVDCHREDEPHKGTMGFECTSCHQPTEWLHTRFDHESTDFPLLGKHTEAVCLDCHEDRTFPKPASTCYDCHAEDDAHDGRSGNECGSCHNPSDWHDSSFNHARDTDFELLGRHGELTCNDCHSDQPFEDQMDTACVSCHLEDDDHEGHNGEQCNTCHSNSAWPDTTFNHGIDTDYELLGGHVEVACNDCHAEPIYEVELTTTCESCHLEDDVHDETLGTLCESCHTEVNWQDPVFFDHDLTSFPLLGAHAKNECENCHTTQAFKEAESECASCHSEEDPHRGSFTGRCGSCHNPVAWDLWDFNHNVQTGFALEGAHTVVACNDCHRSPLDKMKLIEGSCGSCHRTDDVHDNEFGVNCGRCHTTDSFQEVRTLQ